MLLFCGATLLSLGVCLPLFMYYKRSLRPVMGAMFKALGTACALVIALVAALRIDPRCFICVAALALHLCADYALEFSFPLGVGLFLAGHVFYIAYFCQVYTLTSSHVLCLLGFLFILGLFLYRCRKAAGKQLPLFILYGVVLCLLTASAVAGGIFSHSNGGMLAAAGASLFFFSDALLLYRILYPVSKSISWIIMITYYLAQLLLASSCLYL
ncbi:MAG: lysoplasmalogenase [Clostridia bacterium]|nr:lysoplasmalogenase [Clostridia bacterium]